VESSPLAAEETGAMGRGIESRQDRYRVVAFRKTKTENDYKEF
jgi:hypothetical protein